jgi:hypothetical protein
MSEPMCHKARPAKPEGIPDDDGTSPYGVGRVEVLEFRKAVRCPSRAAGNVGRNGSMASSVGIE